MSKIRYDLDIDMHKYPDVMKIAHEKKHPSFDRGTLVPSHINGTLQTLHKKEL